MGRLQDLFGQWKAQGQHADAVGVRRTRDRGFGCLMCVWRHACVTIAAGPGKGLDVDAEAGGLPASDSGELQHCVTWLMSDFRRSSEFNFECLKVI